MTSLLKQSQISLPSAEYKALCKQVHNRDGWKCRSCGLRQNLHCHHIEFRSAGGDDASYNLITLCNDCHESLHRHYFAILAKSGVEWEPVDANTGVRIARFNGWKPNGCTR